jgi:hypothetical protein
MIAVPRWFQKSFVAHLFKCRTAHSSKKIAALANMSQGASVILWFPSRGVG